MFSFGLSTGIIRNEKPVFSSISPLLIPQCFEAISMASSSVILEGFEEISLDEAGREDVEVLSASFIKTPHAHKDNKRKTNNKVNNFFTSSPTF